MEKNGVFSRIKSRWRKIFSKKRNSLKFRENNLSIDEIFDNQKIVIGTILAETSVDFVHLPNGAGVTLYQETQTVYNNKNLIEEKVEFLSSEQSNNRRRRFYRISSGDLNLIRRMTEEIHFQPLNVVYDDNEITEEKDMENGCERVLFKPGTGYPVEKQMLFLKQCLTQYETRPQNMCYVTQGWTVNNFQGLLKYMMKTENCTRSTMLRVEFNNCIPSLQYLSSFITAYSSIHQYTVTIGDVYGTLHAKKKSREKKLRGNMGSFLSVENRLSDISISYNCTISISNPSTPNIMVLARFCRIKKSGSNELGMVIQVDHITGYQSRISVEDEDNQHTETYDQNEQEMILNENDSCCDASADQTDGGRCEDEEEHKAVEYEEMFPMLSRLLDKKERQNKERNRKKKKMEEEEDDDEENENDDTSSESNEYSSTSSDAESESSESD